MHIDIRMDMDNGAFGTNEETTRDGHEAARILRELAADLDAVGLFVGLREPLLDYNGNFIGEAVVRE